MTTPLVLDRNDPRVAGHEIMYEFPDGTVMVRPREDTVEPVILKHLPGMHDQSSHGRRRNSGAGISGLGVNDLSELTTRGREAQTESGGLWHGPDRNADRYDSTEDAKIGVAKAVNDELLQHASSPEGLAEVFRLTTFDLSDRTGPMWASDNDKPARVAEQLVSQILDNPAMVDHGVSKHLSEHALTDARAADARGESVDSIWPGNAMARHLLAGKDLRDYEPLKKAVHEAITEEFYARKNLEAMGLGSKEIELRIGHSSNDQSMGLYDYAVRAYGKPQPGVDYGLDKPGVRDMIAGRERMKMTEFVEGVKYGILGLNYKKFGTDANMGDIDSLGSRMVHSWAASSTSRSSLLFQWAAAKEFGTDADVRTLKRDMARAAQKKYAIPGLNPDLKVSRNSNLADYEAIGIENVSRRVVRRIYNDTQRLLADAGIKEITVTRGMTFDEGVGAPAWARTPGMHQGAPIRTNPMSSWTTDTSTAVQFSDSIKMTTAPHKELGDWYGSGSSLALDRGTSNVYPRISHGGKRSVVMIARVPARAVLSTPWTGWGCLDEREVVLRPTTAGHADVFVFPTEEEIRDKVGGRWRTQDEIEGQAEAAAKWEQAHPGKVYPGPIGGSLTNVDMKPIADVLKADDEPFYVDEGDMADWLIVHSKEHADAIAKHLAGMHDQKSHGRRGSAGRQGVSRDSNISVPSSMSDLDPEHAKAIEDHMKELGGFTVDSMADTAVDLFKKGALTPSKSITGRDTTCTEEGVDWYLRQYRDEIEPMARDFHRDPRQVAGMVAALSANNQWEYANGTKPNLEITRRVLEMLDKNPTLTITDAEISYWNLQTPPKRNQAVKDADGKVVRPRETDEEYDARLADLGFERHGRTVTQVSGSQGILQFGIGTIPRQKRKESDEDYAKRVDEWRTEFHKRPVQGERESASDYSKRVRQWIASTGKFNARDAIDLREWKGQHKVSELPIEVAARILNTVPKGPTAGTGSATGWPNIATAMRIAKGMPVEVALSGPKRRSFHNNFVGGPDDQNVTVDRWIVRALTGLTSQQGFKKVVEEPKTAQWEREGTNVGSYPLVADAVREATKRLRKEPGNEGLTYKDVQAVIWYQILAQQKLKGEPTDE